MNTKIIKKTNNIQQIFKWIISHLAYFCVPSVAYRPGLPKSENINQMIALLWLQ